MIQASLTKPFAMERTGLIAYYTQRRKNKVLKTTENRIEDFFIHAILSSKS
jgi:hypothetical protein